MSTDSTSEKASIAGTLRSMGCPDSADCEDFIDACHQRQLHKHLNTLTTYPRLGVERLNDLFKNWMIGSAQYAIENCLTEIYASGIEHTTKYMLETEDTSGVSSRCSRVINPNTSLNSKRKGNSIVHPHHGL
jgi:hypothetical protein